MGILQYEVLIFKELTILKRFDIQIIRQEETREFFIFQNSLGRSDILQVKAEYI